MLDRGNPGTDAEQWGKYRNQFASPSIAHSQGAGSRCWILAVDGPQSNPESWSIDLRCYWATIGGNTVSAKEAAMATRKKAKGKAQAKRKKPASKATRGRTVRKNKTIPKKVAKKAPRRPAPSKKPRPTAKPAGTPPISEQVPKTVKPEPGPALPVSSEQRIGVVTHYYGHLSVVGMQLEPGATLRVGDVIHICGHTTDFTQRVESLEVSYLFQLTY